MSSIPDLDIRPATVQDLPAILTLYSELDQAYGDLPGKCPVDYDGLWRQVAADTRQLVLVAESGSAIVGTVTVVIVPNLGHHGQPWAAVENVVVRRNCRGCGFGTALLAEAGRIARSYNCYKLTLTTNLQRREAHEFYRRLGWQETHAGFSLTFQPF